MALNNSNKKKKHILYNMFNPRGNGKGITKEEAAKPKTIGRFFRYFSTNFNMMFALNIFVFLGNFPILFGLFALTGNLNINTTAPSSSLFAPIYGAITAGEVNNPVSAALMGVHGVQTQVSMMTPLTKVFFALTLLVVFTFGIVNACIAYVMRNIVKGDSTTLISDIKYCVKRNWKQALLLGIIDIVMIAVIAYDVMFFFLSGSGIVASFLFGMMLIVAMLYVMMRNYMYILLVTFDLPIRKILKNSFIFALLGFKRNIVAFLGGLAVWVLDYLIMTVMFPIGLVLPVIFLVSLTTFMGIYAAYPKIKEVMIDPYYVSDDVGAKERTEDGDDEEEELPEPIFKDRG
ncbi:MAG: DUF624 domain-containing protein [Ruminococcaceae bacterium]|nr:DUF624 domain-containing protein [Oscillospiraceae bacterium]